MKKLFFAIIVIFFVITIKAINPLKVKEFKLENGLTIWLNEDHSQPTVLGCVVVNAGAKDSPNTGIPHYFEHIMFKGTDKIGTTDYKSEKVLLDSIAKQYNQLSQTQDKKKRLTIQKAINRLSINASKYVIPNEFNNLIAKYGGTKLNAATSWDYTIYFNTFSPQFIEQWCELNSERLINPVFRMFQTELETVFEEKNMYVDAMGYMAMEKTLERFFKPHPYQFPILGNTENIKNPNLAEMQKFYKQYYVAGNMGLILTGDIDTEKILPIIKKYFERLPKGTVKRKELPAPELFNGREEFKAKVPVPFVRANARVWRGVPNGHPDQTAIKLVMSLLSNSSKNGLLDQLTIDGKVMKTMALDLSMNDAGAIALVTIPKIPFQTNKSANKLVSKILTKIKRGDFSDELLKNNKISIKKQFLKGLEKKDQRLQQMISAFTMGKTWDEYLRLSKRIDNLTKEEVVEVANKYFTDDYLYVKKKTGNYPGQKIKKPPFKPIVPPNKDSISDYAKALDKLPIQNSKQRFIDFDKDVETMSLTENNLVKLHKTHNSINEIFSLSLVYEIGNRELPTAKYIASYLDYLGTDTLTANEFNTQLQALGSSITFDYSAEQFKIHISGLDENLEPTMELVGSFLTNVKDDEKKFKLIVDEKKINDKATKKSIEEIAIAGFNRVKYGENSLYLTDLSKKELKKKSGKALINDFKTIQSYETHIHYCGTLPITEVAQKIKKHISLEKVTEKSHNPLYTELIKYKKPTIYFIHNSKATQSIIYGFIPLDTGKSFEQRNIAKLFDNYFGKGMSSVMFQEIREFRSLAYRTSSWLQLTPFNQYAKNKSSQLNMMLSTQMDKTTEALFLLDSLVHTVPFSSQRFENTKLSMINSFSSTYPYFRDISKKVVAYQKAGYNEDPNKKSATLTEKAVEQDMKDFYEQNIKNSQVTYLVVGNKKRVNMAQLKEKAEVIFLNNDDII